MDDKNAGLALIQTIIAILIPAVIGYVVFKLVKPSTDYWERSPHNYGRLYLAYTLGFLFFSLISLAFIGAGGMAAINYLVFLAITIPTIGPLSYLIGYLYGKSKPVASTLVKEAKTSIKKTIEKSVEKSVKSPKTVEEKIRKEVHQELSTAKNTAMDAENSEEIGDEEFYLSATKEAEGKKRNEALWAKAMATQMGDENKAKAYYVNKRVLALKALKEQIRLKVYTTIERNISSTSRNPDHDLATDNLFPDSPNAHYRKKIIAEFEQKVKERLEKEFN
jgi:hypothetical protein